MMKIEMVGGPQDGLELDVPDGWRYLNIPLASNWSPMQEGPLDATSHKVVTLAIEPARNGNGYVRWREPQHG